MKAKRNRVTCCHKHAEPLNKPMIVCERCGDKRCPKADDCDAECTHAHEWRTEHGLTFCATCMTVLNSCNKVEAATHR